VSASNLHLQFTALSTTKAWPAMLEFLLTEPDGDSGPRYAPGKALSECLEIGNRVLNGVTA